MSPEMLFELSQVRGAHERFQRAYDPTAFGPANEDYRLAGPVTLAFDIYKNNREFRLAGRLQATLELSCGRCLEAFTVNVDNGFDLMYLPHTENVGEGEIEIEEDDLETAYYRDEVIDLGQMTREQFYLALPMKPLCSEACRGLCPECGTNLNQATCQCVHTWMDPKLEGLRALVRGPEEPPK
jgi:uncharacterized protein